MREACSRNFKSQSKGRRSVWRKSERLLNYRSVSVQTVLSNVANWSIAMCRLGGLVAAVGYTDQLILLFRIITALRCSLLFC
jgi:hypothetical protein